MEEKDKEINDLINKAYQRGVLMGQQQAFEKAIDHLRQASVRNFITNQDEIAKILRGYYRELETLMPRS